MNKVIKFVKENKIITFALAVVVLSFIFLALPGQTASVYTLGKEYSLGGYQFFFGTQTTIMDVKLGSAVGQGIAIFVLLILSFVGLFFSRKYSFVTMLTGLALVVIAILFFTISNAGDVAYNAGTMVDVTYKWVPYLLGAFLVIAGGLVVYKSVMMMKDEIKHPSKPQGPSYSYLKK